jgi:hypothetical protein
MATHKQLSNNELDFFTSANEYACQPTVQLWQCHHLHLYLHLFNPLAPSNPYMGRTAQLTSKRCILNTYSTNIRTEYFKHAA